MGSVLILAYFALIFSVSCLYFSDNTGSMSQEKEEETCTTSSPSLNCLAPAFSAS